MKKTFAAVALLAALSAAALAQSGLTPAEAAVAEAVDILARNKTKIELVANNITLFDAILRIKNLSRANIVFSYMEPADRISETVVTNSALNISEIQVKANAGAASKSRRVTYATSGPMEWRAVLASILAPDYTFDEKDGMVRIATKERFAAIEKKENDEKPMGLRYIRVYNASPEEVLERLTALKVLMSSKGLLQIAPYKEKSAGSVNSYRHNLSAITTSGTATKGGTSLSIKSDSSSSSWGNLLRPRNPPAILAYDAQENLDRIEDYIRTMDVHEKQVLIEALILELSDTGARNLGMNLDKMGLKSINLLNASWSTTKTRDGTSGSDSDWKRSSTSTSKQTADTSSTLERLSGYDHHGTTVKDTVGNWTRTNKSSNDSSNTDKTTSNGSSSSSGSSSGSNDGKTSASSTSSTTGTPTSTATTSASESSSGSSSQSSSQSSTTARTGSLTDSIANTLTETITGGFITPGTKGYGDSLENTGKWVDSFSQSDTETRGLNSYRTRKNGRTSTFSATFGPINFNLVLELVEEEGNGKLLSSPVLTIGDHSEAMIHVGTITPVAEIESKFNGSINGGIAQSLSWSQLQTGVMMWVGPEITDNGDLVRLWIHPSITTKIRDVSATVNGNTLTYPELESEEIDTRVAIPSGNTLMIGGLTTNFKQEFVQRVPILGYIPFIGRLFRHVETKSERRNLVILIRPTILDDEEPDTGFEEPTMRVVEPLNAQSGRNLVDVKVGENDPMLKSEQAIKRFFLGDGDAAATNAVETTAKPEEEAKPSVPPAPTAKPAEAAPTPKPAEATPAPKPAPKPAEAAPAPAPKPTPKPAATPTPKPAEAAPAPKPAEAAPTPKPAEATPTPKPTEAAPAPKPVAAPTPKPAEATPAPKPAPKPAETTTPPAAPTPKPEPRPDAQPPTADNPKTKTPNPEKP